MSRTGLSDVAIGCWHTEAHQRRRGTAMTTVYVVTAGSGDSYRIERVYLDGEAGLRVRPGLQRHRTRRTGAGRGMADRCPAGRLRRPLLAGGVVGARAGQQASRRAAAHRRGRTVRRLRHPPGVVDRRGAARRPKWCAGNWPGYPGWRWWVWSKEKVEESSGTRSPRSGPTWRGSRGNNLPLFRAADGKKLAW